jgi:RHH-type proline utilization regulon transcriptional repressor/proline dehydrogenase/delta 1-pyrroline-5-carboxylate dehydrogenase
LLADARVAGACLAGPDAITAQQLAQQMAASNGPIRPLITADELACDHQQYRFSAEQTLTINTAAAGGNAALLASMH